MQSDIARGTITFNITDYKSFIKLNRLINFDLEQFNNQVKAAVQKYTKNFISNVPSEMGIPVVQIERKILEISDRIKERLKADFESDFGVNLKRFDLATIEPDKESDGWQELRRVTTGQQTKTIEAQTDVNIQNLRDMQEINAQNMSESLRIQREEAQRAQKLQAETNFMGVHAMNFQADVLKTGAENLGQMSNIGNSDGGMNPAGMMTGMAMGAAMGNQMACFMNQMGGQINNSMQAPPHIPNVDWMIAVNGQQSSPYNMQQMQQLVSQGQINHQAYVWRQGMSGWEFVGNIPELAQLFTMATPPLIPGV